ERVEHLMDIAELQAAAEDAAARADQVTAAATQANAPVTTSAAAAAPASAGGQRILVGPVAPTQTTALTDSIAKSLGEAAMLLNNVELQNMRAFGGRGDGRGGGPATGGRGAGANRATGQAQGQ